MKIIDESERLKGEMVGVSLEEEEGIRKRKGVVNNLAEQETSRLLNLDGLEMTINQPKLAL